MLHASRSNQLTESHSQSSGPVWSLLCQRRARGMQQYDGSVSDPLGSKSKYFTAGRIKPLPFLNEERELTDLSVAEGAGEPHASDSREPRLRKRNTPEVSVISNPPKKKKKKASRPYAPPERYAHLTRLPDYLKDSLDGKLDSHLWDLILINALYSCFLWHKVSRVTDIVQGSPAETSPSVMSSTDGHHYAHPTNHFWKCLHLSGFTGPIISSEDHTLPEKYNLGLVSGGPIFPHCRSPPQTNLIDRPSAEVRGSSSAL